MCASGGATSLQSAASPSPRRLLRPADRRRRAEMVGELDAGEDPAREGQHGGVSRRPLRDEAREDLRVPLLVVGALQRVLGDVKQDRVAKDLQDIPAPVGHRLLILAEVATAERARQRRGPGRFDAILLDVDNGPDGLTRAGNDALYDARGLAAARDALRPGGRLAVWSSEPDERFTARLRRAGFAVTVEMPRAHGRRGIRHVVWVATRGG